MPYSYLFQYSIFNTFSKYPIELIVALSFTNVTKKANLHVASTCIFPFIKVPCVFFTCSSRLNSSISKLYFLLLIIILSQNLLIRCLIKNKKDTFVYFRNLFSFYTIWLLASLTTLRTRAFENIVRKGENVGNDHFLLFPLCFLLYVGWILPFQPSLSSAKLTFSQTSPGFYVSAIKGFWKHCRKRRNCS